MFISVFDLFKVGIGPSSSHTMGPMIAARRFMAQVADYLAESGEPFKGRIRCTLKGSLAFTGRGHATDRAVQLGVHGYSPDDFGRIDIADAMENLDEGPILPGGAGDKVMFSVDRDVVFDTGVALLEHPNGMVFDLVGENGRTVLSKTFYSIGGGFISTPGEIGELVAPLRTRDTNERTYDFDSSDSMLTMSAESGLSIAAMKRINERKFIDEEELDRRLDAIWRAMRRCVENGLEAEGSLPGPTAIPRRAKELHNQLRGRKKGADIIEWLCAYAMAVAEENAAGNMVVTAPTNGAAGVIPAILYFLTVQRGIPLAEVRDFLLTAGAIGGLIKYRSSISGAEVGCQGEIGSASAMAAAGLCAIGGGKATQVENAAEIAMEHHLGTTCDPVHGQVQVPCIERNGFGAVKAYTAATLALRGTGRHFMSLDRCIAAMKQTGLDMSEKYKETSRGGLAVSITEC